MKKLISILILLLSFPVLVFAQPGAGGFKAINIEGGDGTVADVISHEGENSVIVSQGHREVFHIHLDAQAIAATEGFMLIDLSNVVNWKHTDTDHIVLEWITLNVNPTTAFRGDVEIGFLTNVDSTNGDLNIFHNYHFEQQAAEVVIGFSHADHGLDLKTDELFGPIDTNSAIWQTDVNIQGPDGNTSYPSGDGDLVMLITRTAGTVDVGISVGYTTK